MDEFPQILAFVKDLNFTTRIDSAAEMQGFKLILIESAEQISPEDEQNLSRIIGEPLEGGDVEANYEAEAWFCSEAKVTGGRIITRVFVSQTSQTLEVRVWCANPGQLTGFLAKIIELLFELLKPIPTDELWT